jgi:hypothetical protein
VDEALEALLDDDEVTALDCCCDDATADDADDGLLLLVALPFSSLPFSWFGSLFVAAFAKPLGITLFTASLC